MASQQSPPPQPGFLASESGATAIEYGLIAAMVTIVIVTGISALGASMTSLYAIIDSAINGALGG